MAENYSIGVEITEEGLDETKARIRALLGELPKLGSAAKGAGSDFDEFTRGVLEGIQAEVKAQLALRNLGTEVERVDSKLKGVKPSTAAATSEFERLLRVSSNLGGALSTIPGPIGQFGGAIGNLTSSARAFAGVGGLVATSLVGIAAAAAATTTAIASLAIQQALAADDLAEAAEIMGVSISRYNQLSLAAQENSGSVQGLSSVYDKLSRSLSKGAEDNERTLDSFANLGLRIDDLNKLSREDAAAIIVKRWKELGQTAVATASMLQILGGSARSESLALVAASEQSDELKRRTEKLSEATEKLSGKGGELETQLNDITREVKLALAEFALEWADPTIRALEGIKELIDWMQKIPADPPWWYKLVGIGADLGIPQLFPDQRPDSKKNQAKTQKQLDDEAFLEWSARNATPGGSVRGPQVPVPTPMGPPAPSAEEQVKREQAAREREKAAEEARKKAKAEAERLAAEQKRQREAAEKFANELRLQTQYKIQFNNAMTAGNLVAADELEIQEKIRAAIASQPGLSKQKQQQVAKDVRAQAESDRSTKQAVGLRGLDQEVTARERLAAVTRLGVNATREVEIQLEIESRARSEGIDKIRDHVAYLELESRVRRRSAADNRISVDSSLEALEQQLKDERALAAVRNDGITAQKLASATIEVDTRIRQGRQEVTEKERQKMIALTLAIREQQEIPRTFEGGVKDAYTSWTKGVNDMGTFGEKVFTDLTTGLRDGLVNGIMEGKLSLDELGKTLMKDLLGKGIDLLMQDMMKGLGLDKLFGGVSSGAAIGTSASSTMLAEAPFIGAAIGSAAAAMLQGGGSGNKGGGLMSLISAGASLFGGSTGADTTNFVANTGNDASMFITPTVNALGNLYNRGNVIPFARGGIIDRPALFPMQSGIGLMGEAGPEGIFPVTRDSKGRLGVRSVGGQDQPRPTVVNNHFSITGPVDRRSEQQVAAAAYRGASIATRRNS